MANLSLYAQPVLAALFIWWFSTGAIFFLDGLPVRTYRWTMAGATALLVIGIIGMAMLGGDTTVRGAYASFFCGLLVWAWQEVGFLMGNITGPRKHACPPGCGGLAHAGHAFQAILYHELALAVSAAAAALATHGQPNQIGYWTFVILWVMRASAKLNVFLGVRNLSQEVLPAHLRFIGSFLTKKPMNPFLPVSVILASAATCALAQAATAEGVSDFTATGFTLLTTMLGLAVLEHLLLVLPLPATALWSWSLGDRARPELAVSHPVAANPRPANARMPGRSHGSAACCPIVEPTTQITGGVP